MLSKNKPINVLTVTGFAPTRSPFSVARVLHTADSRIRAGKYSSQPRIQIRKRGMDHASMVVRVVNVREAQYLSTLR